MSRTGKDWVMSRTGKGRVMSRTGKAILLVICLGSMSKKKI